MAERRDGIQGHGGAQAPPYSLSRTPVCPLLSLVFTFIVIFIHAVCKRKAFSTSPRNHEDLWSCDLVILKPYLCDTPFMRLSMMEMKLIASARWERRINVSVLYTENLPTH